MIFLLLLFQVTVEVAREVADLVVSVADVHDACSNSVTHISFAKQNQSYLWYKN
jgi:hypothetical protein